MFVWKRVSLLVCCLVALPAFAGSVSYDFSGSLGNVSRGLVAELSTGDPSTRSANVSGSDQPSSVHQNIIDGKISFGGLDYQFTDFDLSLQDENALDQSWIFNGSFVNSGLNGPLVNGRTVSDVQLIFSAWGDTGGLTSSQLPQFSLVDPSRFAISFERQLAPGSIGSLSAVPLPAAAWLFISGLGALVGLRVHSKSAIAG